MANLQQNRLERDPHTAPLEDEMEEKETREENATMQAETQIPAADEPKLESRETEGSPRRRARGFAAMNVERRREIASRGGQAAHRKGTAHEFTPEEAREAGRKGGERSRQRTRERERMGEFR